MNRRNLKAAGAVALAAVVGAGAAVGGFVAAGGDDGTTAASEPVVTATPAGATESSSTIAEVYEQAAAAVVEISTNGPVGDGPFGQQEGVGSGFVYDTEGHIVTNHHVVEGADTVTVTFADGTRREATVVGTDPSTDLAVLEVDAPASELQPLELADSGTVQVGDPVVAIGSPFGLEGTVTAGIVSALERQIEAPDGYTIAGAIQTDAAINQGNSGGPLLDATGKVIGVNAQIESLTGGNVGLGFAIPGDTVRSVVSQLISGGEVAHAYLGVEIATIPAEVAAELGGPEQGAVEVTRVVSGSPAADAGLEAATGTTTVNGQEYPSGGDLITAIDGTPVETAAELQAAISAKEPGDEAALTVHRDGSEQMVNVTLGSRPS